MLPRNITALEGKEAEDFIKQDKMPPSDEQKEHLKRCFEIYQKNPIK